MAIDDGRSSGAVRAVVALHAGDMRAERAIALDSMPVVCDEDGGAQRLRVYVGVDGRKLAARSDCSCACVRLLSSSASPASSGASEAALEARRPTASAVTPVPQRANQPCAGPSEGLVVPSAPNFFHWPPKFV